MKFIVCLVVLVACAEALPGSRDLRSTGGCDDPEEVRVAAGETKEGALITHTESDGKYPFNACQAWKIITDENQCIAINVGNGGFELERIETRAYDYVLFKDSDGSSEIRKGGQYQPGYLLFKSETNNVEVRFTSDDLFRFSGFSLDIRSISCTESGYLIQEVVVASGDTVKGAIVSYTGSDDKYNNYARQDWNIITDENQCIVIAVGDGGFNTEKQNDFVTFKDSNSPFENCPEIRREGIYYTGGILFTSKTNSVDVRFTSDWSQGFPGFSLDIRTIPCSEVDEECQSNDRCVLPVQEVVLAAGEFLPGAIVSHTLSNGRYANQACEDWSISTDENQCITITVGDKGFSTESGDIVMLKDSNGGSEHRKEGRYQPGYILFKSETNNVDVRFTSDKHIYYRGFSMDVRSTDCADGK